jgi:hypothetical protein
MSLIAAEILTLRRRTGLVWTLLLLCVGSMIAIDAVLIVLHATDPAAHAPAGGRANFSHLLNSLSLAAVVAGAIAGATAGSADAAAGVLRDLVATGRSRLALYAATIPAGLAILMPFLLAGYVVATAVCLGFADGLATPSADRIAWGLVYVVASGTVACVAGIGVAQLVGSRGVTIGILLGWFLAAEQGLTQIAFLGRLRDGFAGVAADRLRPLLGPGDQRLVSVSLGVAVLVLAAWVAVPAAAGAIRAVTRDA